MKKLYITLVMIVTFFISSNVYAEFYVTSANKDITDNYQYLTGGEKILRFYNVDDGSYSALHGTGNPPENYAFSFCVQGGVPTSYTSRKTNNLNDFATITVYASSVPCSRRKDRPQEKDGIIFYIYGRLGPGAFNQGTTWTYVNSPLGITYNSESQNLRFIGGGLSKEAFIIDQSQDMIISQNEALQDSLNDMVGKQDETNEKLDDLKDSITSDDTSGADSQASNFFSSFESNDFGLTGIITAPLNLISNIVSSNCSPLSLPLPFVNKDLTLPCLMPIYQNHFGGFLTLYQTITFGLISYYVIVNILAMVKGFKDPDKDEIQVIEL